MNCSRSSSPRPGTLSRRSGTDPLSRRLLPEPSEEYLKILGRLAFPGHALAGRRVSEPEPGRVQHRPPGPARVGQGLPVRRPVVHPFPAQRPARLAEMNTHLVRPPRLEPALDQCKVAELLQRLHVRNGALTVAG